MKCSVVVAFMKLMQPQGKATPNYPTLQVGFFVIENQIVGPAEWPAPVRKDVFLKNHYLPFTEGVVSVAEPCKTASILCNLEKTAVNREGYASNYAVAGFGQ